MISQALRCKLDVNLPPDVRCVPPTYFKAAIPMLHEQDTMLLRNVVGVDKTLTSNLPTQPTPGISAPPLVQPQA